MGRTEEEAGLAMKENHSNKPMGKRRVRSVLLVIGIVARLLLPACDTGTHNHWQAEEKVVVATEGASAIAANAQDHVGPVVQSATKPQVSTDGETPELHNVSADTASTEQNITSVTGRHHELPAVLHESTPVTTPSFSPHEHAREPWFIPGC